MLTNYQAIQFIEKHKKVYPRYSAIYTPLLIEFNLTKYNGKKCMLIKTCEDEYVIQFEDGFCMSVLSNEVQVIGLIPRET